MKADCFVRVIDINLGISDKTVRNFLKDMPGFDRQDNDRAVNCYGDNVLNIYEFAFLEGLIEMYKLPKYKGVVSPNLKNNNQPGTYNPNYSSQ